MSKYVALLRGVNVGGRILKMADLKLCFEKGGYKNVKTYLQSGNVAFESGSSKDKLKAEIETLLADTFKYPAKVIVVGARELKKIIEDNPFQQAEAGYHQYVIFFENGLENDFTKEITDTLNEQVQAGDGVVYWMVKKGETLKSARGKLLTKAKYRQFNTNRNINTLQKLVAE